MDILKPFSNPFTATRDYGTCRFMASALERADPSQPVVLFANSELSSISHMAMEILAEILAATAHRSQDAFHLRVYLAAAHMAKPAVSQALAHEDTPQADPATLCKTRFKGSSLHTAYDDDYLGKEPYKQPAKTTEPSPRAPGNVSGFKHQRDREPIADKFNFDEEVQLAIKNGSWKCKIKGESGKPLPTAKEAGFSWSARFLWPLIYGEHGPVPKKFAKNGKKVCIICAGEHSATDCQSYDGIGVGDAWWKLYEEAMDAESDRSDTQRCVPTERPADAPTYFKNGITRASKRSDRKSA